MCAVSVILDYGARVNPYQWTEKSLNDYKELIEKARVWDEEMEQPECEDESKAEWIKLVEERLRKQKKMVGEEVNFDDLPKHLQEYLSNKSEENTWK